MSSAFVPAGLASAQTLRRSRGVLNKGRSYSAFLDQVRADARRHGISDAVADAALSLAQPNARVLKLDHHQPEFTLSWSRYRQLVVTTRKIQDGRSICAGTEVPSEAIGRRYKVQRQIAVAIWGIESDYGAHSGSFGVVDALATLAYDGRRAEFFYSELINALRILNAGDVDTSAMLGSYAGAMGQPQFMPSSYLRYAVDYDGDGKRDIWSTKADSLASICNYLAENGWSAGAPWGQPVLCPPAIQGGRTGRTAPRSLDEWMLMGVRRVDGRRFTRGDVLGAILRPDGPDGDVFMVYANFDVIRRYNPSDFYSLAVGVLGNAMT